ncbi:hypothetical protein F4825DRAFT_274171 [Nemania diffusa]|nr:hypothetical protein F4825DRAFT_274171 [Nemania diffusa]
MSALSRLVTPGSSKSRVLDAPGPSSDSNQGRNRVLHGRVAKPINTRISSKPKKYKAFAQDSEDVENDEGQDEDGSNNEDDEEEAAIGPSVTMMVQDSDYSDSEGGAGDGTDSGSDSEPDSDTAWRREQIYLNTILNARNKFTLMPSTWRMHFRGIPLPDSLFYIKTKSKSIRPRIYARTDRLEYRGAVALRRLIDVHARIQDIRDHEAAVKDDEKLAETEKKEIVKTLSTDMAKQLRRALEQALDWSRQDGELNRYDDQLPSNVKIMELKGIKTTDQPESEMKIETDMCILAEEWRTHSQNREVQVDAPVIFGFVIMKHIITIVTLDASDPDAIIHVPCQLHMAERNQHQWNALAILVTICWARDVSLDYINAGPDLEPVVKEESSDPDA